MKQGWAIETISSLCEQMNGIWKGEKEPLTTVKILRTTNFSKDCQMKLDDLAIIEVEQKKMEKRRLKRGDIIVEKSGGGPKQPVGRVILFNIDDEDFSFCNFTSALRIKDQTKILPEFLHKYLTYLYFSGETEKYQSNLVGFRNLDFKGYVSISVKYPSISEQQRIVNLLDAEFTKIDALKANAEKNLQNAKDLYQSILRKTLTPSEDWIACELKDVCNFYNGKPHENDVDENGNYILVNSKFISSDMTARKRVNNQLFPLFVDDIVMVMSDVPNGKALAKCQIIDADNTYSLNQRICVFRDSKLNVRFLYYLINRNSFLLAFNNGENQTNLRKNDIVTMPIRYPQNDIEIERIVERLDALNDKCKTLQVYYEKTLSLCDDLKQALLRKAFNGEI